MTEAEFPNGAWQEEEAVRFVPPEASGWPEVTEVAIYRDRIEVQTAGKWVTVRFKDIAQRQEHRLVRWLKQLVGRRPNSLVVGKREYCTSRRYVMFFCTPPLKVYTPPDPEGYVGTYIFRINAVLRAGGYDTWDMS